MNPLRPWNTFWFAPISATPSMISFSVSSTERSSGRR